MFICVCVCSPAGSLTLDCTPGLVSAESLVSPQPPGKSAARMLALALAESAQQVALHSHRSGGEGGGLNQQQQQQQQQPQSPSSPTPKLPLLNPDWPPHSPPHGSTPTADTSDPLASDTFRSAGVSVANATPLRAQSGPNAADERPATITMRAVRVCGVCGGEEREQGVRGAPPVPRLCHCSVSAAKERPAVVLASTGTTTTAPLAQEPAEWPRGTAGTEEQRCGSPKPLQPLQHHHPQHHQHQQYPPQPKPVPPTPPRRTAESRIATAALQSQSREAVNAANFRMVLAEASAPASVKEAFPHPSSLRSPGSSYPPLSPEEDPYGHVRSGRHRRGPPPPFHPQPDSLPPHLGGLKVHPKSSSYESHYGTLGPRSLHQSMKYKEQYRDEHPSTTHFRRTGQWYAPLEGALVYPTIRRVRSLHAPPEDRPFFFQNHPYPPPRKGHAEIHQVQPYFENGKVQYRYNPYSDSTPYGDTGGHRGRQCTSHAYTLRRVPAPPPHPSAKMGCYPNPLSHVIPEKDYSFHGHEGGYFPRMEDASLPSVWNSEFPPDRHYHQATHRRDGSKRKPQGPVNSQQQQQQQPYGGVGMGVSPPPRPKPEASRRESRHVRHRSDSGRDLLISTEEPGGHFKVTMVSQSSPEQLFPEGESSHAEPLRKAELGARETLLLKQNSAPYRHPQQLQESRPLPPHLSLHKEYSCPDFKHSDSSGGGGPSRDTERALYRTLSSRYADEDFYYPPRTGVRGAARPERPSIKGHLPPDRPKKDPPDPWATQYHLPKVRSHSFVASRYDTMEGYMPAPLSVPGAQSRTPKPGPFPSHGCMPPSSHRLYSTALGQGGFLQGQPRPETEVYVE